MNCSFRKKDISGKGVKNWVGKGHSLNIETYKREMILLTLNVFSNEMRVLTAHRNDHYHKRMKYSAHKALHSFISSQENHINVFFFFFFLFFLAEGGMGGREGLKNKALFEL